MIILTHAAFKFLCSEKIRLTMFSVWIERVGEEPFSREWFGLDK